MVEEKVEDKEDEEGWIEEEEEEGMTECEND